MPALTVDTAEAVEYVSRRKIRLNDQNGRPNYRFSVAALSLTVIGSVCFARDIDHRKVEERRALARATF